MACHASSLTDRRVRVLGRPMVVQGAADPQGETYKGDLTVQALTAFINQRAASLAAAGHRGEL